MTIMAAHIVLDLNQQIMKNITVIPDISDLPFSEERQKVLSIFLGTPIENLVTRNSVLVIQLEKLILVGVFFFLVRSQKRLFVMIHFSSQLKKSEDTPLHFRFSRPLTHERRPQFLLAEK